MKPKTPSPPEVATLTARAALVGMSPPPQLGQAAAFPEAGPHFVFPHSWFSTRSHDTLEP